MSTTQYKRRLIENEVVFRSRNRDLQKSLAQLEKMAKEDGQESELIGKDANLLFFCECADEDCTQRIELSVDRYEQVHSAKDQFCIAPEHNVPDIEDVILKDHTFWVVRKHEIPPTEATLHKTNVHNV